MTYLELSVASPLGPLRLVTDGAALIGVYMEDQVLPPALDARDRMYHPVLAEARRQLAAWFAGERTTFDLPLRPSGTSFQLAVWDALTRIPFGETQTYAEVARAVGRPAAARAVGAANACNPLSIVVPCHRVVGAGVALTGYAGGLSRKQWLLAHEQRIAATGLPSLGRC